jgi:RNA polymerase sigma factor (sigma-70 family)
LEDALEHILSTANRFPLLTAGQEIELGRQIRAWQDHVDGPDGAPSLVQRRGRRALDKFLLCNLRLAHYIARRYKDRGVPMEDLVQAASEGLLQAYKRFDPAKGYRSSSYACWWAQQACQVIVAQQGNGLKLPTSISEALRKASRVTQILAARLNREPTDAELEEAMDMKPGGLSELRANGRKADVLSLDFQDKRQSGGGDPRSSLLDTTAGADDPAADLERQEIRVILADILEHSSALTPQQRHLLRCRYLETDKAPSLARMASQLNMNRETLRRVERSALETLRGLLPSTTRDYRALL